jgi:EAL domain-containing protein (putative c-di-GMP-specific phosphodiesterase class I)
MRSREPSLPSPIDIVKAAERLDRVYDMGRMVRRRVGAAMERLPDKSVHMFMNLHTSELLDGALYDGSSPLAPFADRMVLEVTERTAIEKIQDVKARASVLRFHGFRLAIDDLGAGFAGLTSFVTLEPDVVKLDISLVRDVDTVAIKQQLIRSVVDLCHQLQMRVVAEGIETQAELRTVRMLGCDHGQGYFIARPMESFAPISELRV